MHLFHPAWITAIHSLLASVKSPWIDYRLSKKLLIRSSKWSHVSASLISLHWLPIKSRVHRTLRSPDQDLLSVPESRLKTKGDRALQSWPPNSGTLSLEI
ncbi:hypothetical protein LDENG_00085440 [Lucifuga dentata]|nr:hypothetical protein LDENG_00085440 [Lucifuga dentata]